MALILIYNVPSEAFLITTNSARGIALGNATCVISGTGYADAIFQNPAGLAVSSPAIMSAYNNNLGLPGYDIYSVAATGSIGRIGLGFAFNRENVTMKEASKGSIVENGVRENQIGFGLGCSFGENLKAGFSIWNFDRNLKLMEADESYQSLSTGTAIDLGMVYDTEKWGLGFSAIGLPLQMGKEEASPEYVIGLRFGKANNLNLMIDGSLKEKPDGKYELAINSGIEAWILPNIALRLGVNQSKMVTAGIGTQTGRLVFDYAYKIHEAGNTHYLTSSYVF